MLIVSENITCFKQVFGDNGLTNNFWIVSLVLPPLPLGVAFHLHLKHVVVVYEIASQIWKTRVLDNDSSGHILGDKVVLNQSCCVLLGQQPTCIIVQNLILLNKSFGSYKDDTVEVIVYGVLFDQELLFSFNNKYAFTLGVFDHIELYLCLS